MQTFGKHNPYTSSGIIAAGAIAISMLLVIVPALFAMASNSISPYQVAYEYNFRKLPFNTEKWKSVRRFEGDYLLRLRMFDSLKLKFKDDVVIETKMVSE
jgi:hypothetical protein